MLFLQLFASYMTFSLCTGEELKNLTILAIYPFTGPIWPGGWSCFISIQTAIEQINARTDILAEYTLMQDYIDTECDAGTSVFRMVQKFQKKPYVMLIGPVTSAVAIATASASHHWNLTQLSFSASSPVLADQKRFPNFYRLGVPDKIMNAARIGLMNKFGWKKIATIHFAIEFFSTMMDDFTNDVNDHNITIFTQQVFVKDSVTQLRSLKENDARIIISAMYETQARSVLCTAYKIGLYGPKIVWMFMGFLSSQFWTKNNDDVDCTEEEMITVAEGVFFFQSASLHTERRGLANITYSELIEIVTNHPNYNPNLGRYDAVVDNCFDTAWTAALTLNCTVAELEKTGYPKTLDQFGFEDVEINNIIDKCIAKTSFSGVLHNIYFQSNREAPRSILIERVQNGERHGIGMHLQDNTPHRFEWYDGELHWKDGKIPRDSTYVTKKEVVIPTVLYTSMCVCAAIGIAIAAFFFTFNIVFKDNRLIKMSSSNINNVLLLGCIICYTVIFIKTIEVSSAIVCQIRVFCFCLGFTITFGSLFSKTWRVYRIFTNKKLVRMRIKDIQLLAIIGALAAIVLLVLSIWEAVLPHKMVIRLLDKEINIIGNDEEIHPYVRTCRSDTSSFDWALYILEGLMLAFGAFLAWETRHVKIAALNDSHEIGLCLYNVVILSAVGLTLSLLLDEQEVMLYGVTSGCLLMGTTLTQLVVFIPKVYAVYNKIDALDDSNTVTAGCSSSAPSVSKKSVSGAKFVSR